MISMGKGKIAVYTRVSTDDQAENGYSLREQKRSILNYIDLYKEELSEEIQFYVDEGTSEHSC